MDREYKNRVNQCYRFETIETPDHPLFDQEVDATYVLHLEGNGRYENVLDQLHKYPPTKIIYIAFNPGFRSCPKEPYVTISLKDITDAFINVFMHAEEQGYRNILVLEDDFFFDPRIRNEPIHVKRIQQFLQRIPNPNFMYHVGTLPILQRPAEWNAYHYRITASAGTHACIYSRAMRREILSLDPQKIRDWDLFNNYHCRFRYGYYHPLCYQLFTATENQTNWIGSDGPNEAWNKWWGQLGVTLFNSLKLNQEIVPGYPFFIMLSKSLYWILWTLLFIILYELYVIMYSKKRYTSVIIFLLVLLALPVFLLMLIYFT
jgi:hypothetical protein